MVSCGPLTWRQRVTRAFSSEVDTGSRKEKRVKKIQSPVLTPSEPEMLWHSRLCRSRGYSSDTTSFNDSDASIEATMIAATAESPNT